MAKAKSSTFSAESFAAALIHAKKALGEEGIQDPSHFLKSAGLKSPIFIVGEQHIRIGRLIDWLKENVFVNELGATAHSYFASELNASVKLQSIAADLKSPSLFSRFRLFVFYEADKIRASLADGIADAVSVADPDCWILFVAAAVNQKTAIYNRLKNGATLVEIEDPKGNALQRWIEKEAKRAGASGIERDALALLMQSFSADTNLLSQEIQKLGLLVEKDQPISKSHVEQLTLRHPERTTFQLIAEIGKKNAPRAGALCQDLLDQGMHPLQLSAFLSRSLRTLIALSDHNESSLNSELGNHWFLKNLSSVKKSFRPAELQDALETICKLDFELKNSDYPPEVATQLAVQHLVMRKPWGDRQAWKASSV